MAMAFVQGHVAAAFRALESDHYFTFHAEDCGKPVVATLSRPRHFPAGFDTWTLVATDGRKLYESKFRPTKVHLVKLLNAEAFGRKG